MKAGQAPVKNNNSGVNSQRWWEPINPSCVVLAKYRYRTKEPGHVLFNYNDVLFIEAKHKSNPQWLRGHNITTGQSGIIPRPYTTYDSLNTSEVVRKPFMDEIDEVNQVLRTWALQMSHYVLAHDASRFIALQQRAARLLALRWALVSSVERNEPTVLPAFTFASEDGKSQSASGSSSQSLTSAAAEKPHYLKESDLRVLVTKINEEIDNVVSQLGLDMNVFITKNNERVRATLLNTGPNQLLSLFEEHSPEGLQTDEVAHPGELRQPAIDGIKAAHKRRFTLIRRSNDLAGLESAALADGSLSSSGSQNNSSSSSLTGSAINAQTSGSMSSSSAGDEHMRGITFQVIIQMVMILVEVGSEFEARFSLFSTKTNEFFTEECCIKFGADAKPSEGKPESVACRVIFRDVENVDLSSDGSVYLVMRIIRLGMLDPKGRNMPEHPFRRPFGAGCAKLSVDNCDHGEYEFRVDMHCCPDSAFGTMPQTLIGISEGTLASNALRDQDIRQHTRSKGIIMNAQFFRSDFDSLVSTYPALRESKVMMTLRTPTVVMPGTKRNDFYVALREGDLNEKNVELLVSVRPNNNIQEQLKCIVQQDGSLSTVHRSLVLTTSNPKWYETIKLRLSEEELVSSHLLIECQHISSDGKVNKPHCAGFFFFGKNRDDGSTEKIVVPNQKFKVSLFKPHINKAGEEVPYLDDPERKMTKSFINICIASASTEFSQDETLHDLFHGISHSDAIPDVLRRLTFMEPQDIVKYLDKVFSALFGIVDQFQDDEKLIQEVYDAIVRLLTKFSDTHWSWNFRPALDKTIEELQGTTHYSTILNSMQQALTITDGADNGSNVQRAIESMKVLDYLWMIIQRSREASTPDQQTGAGSAETGAFQTTVEQFLSSLRSVLLSKSQKMMSAKVSVMKHLPTILQGMTSFVEPNVLCSEITDFFSIADSLERNGKLNESKLHFYWSIAKSSLMDDISTRKALMPHLVHYTWHHLLYDLTIISGRKEKPKLNEMLEYLQKLSGRKDPSKPEESGAKSSLPPKDKFRAEDRLLATREGRRCIGIFGTLADKIALSKASSVAERDEALVLLLTSLPLIVRFFSFIFSDPSTSSIVKTRILPQDVKVGDMRGVILVAQTLVNMTPSYVWEGFMEKTITDESSRVSFLTTLSEMMRRSVESPLPKQWAELVGFQFSAVLHFIHLLSCSKEFCRRIESFAQLKEPKDDGQNVDALGSFRAMESLIEEMMILCTEFVVSPHLSKSMLSVSILEKYGDMRLPMCTMIRKLWSLLGEQKFSLPTVLDRLIRMNGPEMSSVPQIQNTSFALIAEFCAASSKSTELFDRIRVALLEVFDLATEERNQCEMCQNVISRLRASELCAKNSEAQAVLDSVEKLVAIKQKLEETRADYADKLSHETEGANQSEIKCAALDKMVCVLHDLHDFLCSIPKSESLRCHYIEMISDVMKDRKKYDSGLAFKRLYKSYSWDDTSFSDACFAVMEPQQQQIPLTQPTWKTKEEVGFAAAKALKFGNLQEEALDILEEVRKFQMENEFDYLGAANTLRMEAENATDLTKGDRIPRDYYRVGFFGSDLPPEIKNKDFIYAARPLEKLLDFQERIQIAYPDSEVLKKTDAPGAEYTETPGMKLLITNVVLCNDKEIEAAMAALPETSEQDSFDKSAPCSVFVYSKPVRKKKLEKGENEFRGLYINKQFFFTSEPLPNSRVRTEIVKQCEAVITPIQNACNMVSEKNDELRALIKKYEDCAPGSGPSVQPLAMALNGCIMAAVNGGLAMYQEAFLNEQFRQEEPEEAVHQATLLADINEQMVILDQGLQTFERHCTPDMSDLMGLLKEMFEKMCATWANQGTDGKPKEKPADDSVLPVAATAAAETVGQESTVPIPTNGVEAIQSEQPDPMAQQQQLLEQQQLQLQQLQQEYGQQQDLQQVPQQQEQLQQQQQIMQMQQQQFQYDQLQQQQQQIDQIQQQQQLQYDQQQQMQQYAQPPPPVVDDGADIPPPPV